MAIPTSAILEAASRAWNTRSPLTNDEIRGNLEWAWGLEYGRLDAHLANFLNPNLVDVLMDDNLILFSNVDRIREIILALSKIPSGSSKPRKIILNVYKGCKSFGYLVLPVDPLSNIMDLGVGSFVFSNGVVSAIPLIKNPRYLQAPLFPKLRTVVRKTLPIIALGVIRVLLVKGTDYPEEHETEYGTHWNFFITLALLPVFQVLLHPLIYDVLIRDVPLSCLAAGLRTHVFPAAIGKRNALVPRAWGAYLQKQ
ncbi:hypothetical protein GGX14DRAFT_555388 [Mycena pura]|uniref:GPI-anchored wall transfer protein 1 n=1 Tax=Mycena pura TaxID=153505 RepID=A0AAD6YQQ3_9AGAR|nr:hypothetical protein GGX14DRAFT_555388 [Mycena pura]